MSSALLVRDVVADWKPTKIILVGIAAGIGQNVRLGDVVISEQIVDYELAKITTKGTTPRWSVYRSDAQLLSSLMTVKGTDWTSRINGRRPDGSTATPTVHVGLILSGNKVIADSKQAGALRSVWNRAVGIEMEGAGAAAAVYQMDDAPSFLMVKGICDYANAHKNDDWHAYAADVASALVAAYIGYSDLVLNSDAEPSSREKAVVVSGVDLHALRLALSEVYNLSELSVLANDLKVDWEEVAPGAPKSERIGELIRYCKRRSNLDQLIITVKRDRPQFLESFVSPGTEFIRRDP